MDAMETLPAPTPSTLLVARNPGEMAQAQSHLVSWADAKLAELRADLKDMESEVKNAKAKKWRVSGLSRQCSKVRGRLSFYEKIHAALKAGYALIPEFPVGVFAIRVDPEMAPSRNEAHYRNQPGGVRDQESDQLPVGEGTFVSEQAKVLTMREDRKDEKGQPYKYITQWASAFQDVDMPMALAKPVLSDALDRAMAIKCFDELGICPERRTRGRDPIIVGRVLLREGWRRQYACFLVAWYLDTRTL